MLFHERDRVADLLGGIVLYVIFPVAQRSGQLEDRDPVFFFQTAGNDTVAKQ